MKDKPKFSNMHTGRFTDDIPNYFTVVTIKSDGQNFFIEVSEQCIPAFTKEVLDKMHYILSDAIYRLRPDLKEIQ